jgi:hypothetical protein
LLRESKSEVSTSIRCVSCTFFISVKAEMCEPPRPLIPATPMRTVSLAPITRPDALVPPIVNSGKAAPAAAAERSTVRREIRFMAGSWWECVGRMVAQDYSTAAAESPAIP